MRILADIGGTYARFATETDGRLENIHKYEAEKFENLGQALAAYCKESNLENTGSLKIATAGYEENGVWKFVNKNKWVIDPESLDRWAVEGIWNDFEAATWALLDLKQDDVKILKNADGASNTKVLIGPGTGLGLGYLQKTHGGHMPVSALTDEQALIVQTVQRQKAEKTIPVFENFVSGAGLYNIYSALCLVGGKVPAAKGPEDLLDLKGDITFKKTLDIFHEFFGLFAANAVITGHAYGGVYLTGGVLQHLINAKLFDPSLFAKWFCLNAVASVKRDLQNTPVIYITDPYPALRGLQHA